MPILTDIPLLLTCLSEGGQGDVHPVENAALAWRNDTIEWVGEAGALPDRFSGYDVVETNGMTVIPGLVDCHTHLAFGGWRDDEFELRCRGTTYQEIARAGGGILKTVRQTRQAGEDELVERCEAFLRRMIRLGVTTVECKSGYGLSLEEELKLLGVYRRLRETSPAELVSTLLAAHTVPPEHGRAAYVELVCREIIPAAGGLAEFCDVFVEEGAFTVEEARRILRAGMENGMRGKLHADQLGDSKGALLAAELGAVSADHLEYASSEGIYAMAEAGVTAVNLPFATLYLRQRPFDARSFIDAGVAVAVATDFNPGSAPSYDLPLAMTLACVQSGMTPAEALKGATLYAARALDREERIGSLEAGKRADFVLIDAPSVNHWLYHYRPDAVVATFASGRRIYQQ